MTSGTFHIVPIDDIVVSRDERQRKELTKIDILADSIRRLGLIHPLVVTREGLELVAGERRYAACKSLGWTSVPVQWQDEVDPARLRAIELEENVKRQDIEWQDQVSAVLEYHNYQLREQPGWNSGDTAAALGYSGGSISDMLMIGKEIAEGNTTVAESPKLSVARGIVYRNNERREQAILDKLHGRTELPKGDKDRETILTADFTSWVLDYKGPRFNFVHCDFPYGIQADTFNQGGAKAHGGYEDSPQKWHNLMIALEIATRKLCTPSAHLMFWFAMRKGDQRLFESTASALEAMGWEINPMPLIWMKSDGAGILPDPERGPRQIYETCFLGSRGDRKIVRAVANAYAAPTVRERHMSEKPEPMLRHFFGMLVDQNTTLLDPTCGSGSAIRAAESLGASYTLGLEVDPGFADLARDALKRARNLRKLTETVA